MLAPVLGELHRPPERPGRQRHQQLLGPRVVDLHAEAAADVGRDHVDLAEVEAELGGDRGPDAGRGLGRRPHRSSGRRRDPSGRPCRGPPSACRRCARWSGRGTACAAPTRSPRGRRRSPAPGGRRRCRARRRGPATSPPRAASMPTTGGRNSYVDPDPADRVLGDVAVVGDDERDRLADVVHLVLRQGVLRAAVGQRRVRDQQRQRLGHRSRSRSSWVHTAWTPSRSSTSSTSMSVIRAWACGERSTAAWRAVRGPRRRRTARAAQEPLVLDALDLGAHQLAWSWRDAAAQLATAISAARSTAFTMFW